MLSLLLSVAVVTSSFVVQLNAQDVYGCNSSWILMPDKGIYGGVLQPNVTTEEGCRAACYRNTSCQGIDWNPSYGEGNRCFLQSTQESTRSFPGVSHWNYNRTAPCAGVCGAWTPYAAMGIYGGIEQPSVTTEDACKTACVNNGSCTGIDWNPMNGPGHQCYLQFSRGPIYNSTGVTHWEYNSTAGCQLPCGTWTPISNTGVYGGIVEPSVTSEQECRLTCVGRLSCTGVDWNPNNDAEEQCFLQSGNGIMYLSSGITHWNFNRTGYCSVDCLFAFTESANTGIPGGWEQPGINNNVTDCKRACVMNQTCVGIDWNPSNGQWHQCYLHVATGPRFIWNGVIHYDLDRSVCSANPPNGLTTATTVLTAPSGTCRWYRSPNSNIYGGTQDPADTLDACLLACQGIQGCVAVDFVANNPTGAKCFRHVTQLGRQPATWGVDHYDLNCTTNLASAMNLEMATTVGGVQDCWSVVTDNHSNGGDLNSMATDVEACKAACLSTGSCKAIDWDRTQNPSSACYIFTTALTTYQSVGVDHYQYDC